MPLRRDPGSEPAALEARPVVGDDPQLADLAGVGVGQVLYPADAEEDFDLGQSGLEERDGVAGGLGDGDGAGEVDLGPVVDDPAAVPGARTEGLELAEVGLPDAGELADLAGVPDGQTQPVASQRPVHRRVAHRARLDVVDADPLELGQLAVPPRVPARRQRLGVGLDRVLGRRGPRALRR